MAKYSSELLQTFFFTEYAGSIKNASIIGKFENKECADIVKIYATISNNKIEKCTFQAMGSVVVFATMSAICKLATNKTLEDAYKISEKEIIRELGELNKQNFSVVVFALQSFKQTLANFQKKFKDGKVENKANQATKLSKPAKGIIKFESGSSSFINVNINENKKTEIATGNTNSKETLHEDQQENVAVVTEENKEERSKSLKQNKSTKTSQADNKNNKKKLDANPNTVTTTKSVTTTKKRMVKVDSINSNNEQSYNRTKQESDGVEDSELLIKPVSSKKKRISVPKKETPKAIEVRVVEGKEQPTSNSVTTKTTTTKVVTKRHQISNNTDSKSSAINANNSSKDNLILSAKDFREIQNPENSDENDELDTITAKLSNAISELNFKFDDTDNN
ncbi:MAG: iron-sulfur cluster assembly scaffold protein [Christensenellales bacterium]